MRSSRCEPQLRRVCVESLRSDSIFSGVGIAVRTPQRKVRCENIKYMLRNSDQVEKDEIGIRQVSDIPMQAIDME
jgi:hypothetical protein